MSKIHIINAGPEDIRVRVSQGVVGDNLVLNAGEHTELYLQSNKRIEIIELPAAAPNGCKCGTCGGRL